MTEPMTDKRLEELKEWIRSIPNSNVCRQVYELIAEVERLRGIVNERTD